jgi:hypothetical protein
MPWNFSGNFSKRPQVELVTEGVASPKSRLADQNGGH